MIASTLALILSDLGYLLDLDFCGPSTHATLGIDRVYPEEDKGHRSNTMIELLAITRWGPLDFLIIDMPPGIGDATLAFK